MLKQFYLKKSQFNECTVSMSKTVPFQKIQFSIIAQFTSIWPIDRTLSGATTPGQSGPGSDNDEGVREIRINCFPKKKNERWHNGNFQNEF